MQSLHATGYCLDGPPVSSTILRTVDACSIFQVQGFRSWVCDPQNRKLVTGASDHKVYRLHLACSVAVLSHPLSCLRHISQNSAARQLDSVSKRRRGRVT